MTPGDLSISIYLGGKHVDLPNVEVDPWLYRIAGSTLAFLDMEIPDEEIY